MSTTATDRTWTAKITVGNEVFEAQLSEYDLKRDQTQAAVREIAALIEAGITDHARVTLYKTTKAHGTREDANVRVWWERGKVRTF